MTPRPPGSRAIRSAAIWGRHAGCLMEARRAGNGPSRTAPLVSIKRPFQDKLGQPRVPRGHCPGGWAVGCRVQLCPRWTSPQGAERSSVPVPEQASRRPSAPARPPAPLQGVSCAPAGCRPGALLAADKPQRAGARQLVKPAGPPGVRGTLRDTPGPQLLGALRTKKQAYRWPQPHKNKPEKDPESSETRVL